MYKVTCNRFDCSCNSWHKDAKLPDAFNDEFRTGIPSRASTFSHASFINRIGALFFDPIRKKKTNYSVHKHLILFCKYHISS